MLVDGVPVSASLFDAGLYLFHNAAERVARGSGPYLYLPKLESHHEARLWNEVFVHAQASLGVPRGSIRATVLIETITAAFEMDEILFELREHAAGLNAGRWDYLFSVIKRFRSDPELVVARSIAAHDDGPVHARLHPVARADLPPPRSPRDRRHGRVHPEPARPRGHGTGARQGPRGQGARVSATASTGRGSPIRTSCRWRPEIFDSVLGFEAEPEGSVPGRRRHGRPSAADLSDFRVDGGAVTDAGIRANVRVALAYLDAWLRGTGAAAIDNLMEDAATAEIARSQLWLWRTRGLLSVERYAAFRDEELERLGGVAEGRLKDAWEMLDHLVLDDDSPSS